MDKGGLNIVDFDMVLNVNVKQTVVNGALSSLRLLLSMEVELSSIVILIFAI